MKWASNRQARALVAGVLAFGLAGAAIAGPVVIRATGPSARAYPAGSKLADNAQLSLKAGDTVMLLDARGTRTVSGPGTFPAVGTSTRVGTLQTATRALNAGSAERRGGAVRGGTATAEVRSPNLWLVDLSKPGTVCVADANAVRVWRAGADKAADVKVSGGGGSGSIALAPGATVAAWPKTMPVKDGAEYTLAMEGMTPSKIKFAVVPPPASLEDTAAALIAKGCKTQLDLLIATTGGAGNAG